MIVEQITFDRFVDRFREMGRRENFSYEGLEALYEYFCDLSEDIGQPFVLDVISICCEYTEYDNLNELLEDYGNAINYSIDDDLENEEIEEKIRFYTDLLSLDNGGYIIRQF